MTKFVLGRLAAMVGVLLVLAFIILCLQRYTPADPMRAKLGANAPRPRSRPSASVWGTTSRCWPST